MTTQRTDTHRPSLLDPSEYAFVAAFYQGASEAMQIEYRHDHAIYTEAIEGNESGVPGKVFQGNHTTKGTCDHCGASFNHGVLFRHTPTGDLIHIGHICASETVGLPDRAAVVRRNAERARAAEIAREKQMAATADWREANQDIVEYLAAVHAAEMAWREAEKPTKLKAPHHFLNDMVHTLNRWGALSERQAAAVKKFMASDAERAANPAPVEAAPEAPLVEGRRTISGVVTTIKWQENDFGGCLKMRVKEADGNAVWGTVPNSICNLAKGDTVSLTATVERSRDDEHFGFYKRPSKATVIQVAQ